MTMNEQILAEIQSMNSELKSSLAIAARGEDVDISKFPDRLVKLHQEVEALETSNRGNLADGFEELLSLLDDLSKEIHKKYEDVGRNIKMLDG